MTFGIHWPNGCSNRSLLYYALYELKKYCKIVLIMNTDNDIIREFVKQFVKRCMTKKKSKWSKVRCGIHIDKIMNPIKTISI